jgi:hypothetical protein
MANPVAPMLSAHAPKLLEAVQFQGRSNDCGPFTTATVLNALLGLNIEAAQLARQMDRPVWRGPLFIVRRVPNWATFPWGIADVLGEHGIGASWKFLASVGQLYEDMEKGNILMPVIGSWKPLWAHVMTLIAWDPQKGWGFANTQYDDHNVHWVRDDLFQRQWNAMARLLIRAKPPSQG